MCKLLLKLMTVFSVALAIATIVSCVVQEEDLRRSNAGLLSNFSSHLRELALVVDEASPRQKRSVNASASVGFCNLEEDDLSELNHSLEVCNAKLGKIDAVTNETTCNVLMIYVQNMARYIRSQTELLEQMKPADYNIFEFFNKRHTDRLRKYNLIVDILKFILLRGNDIVNSAASAHIDRFKSRLNTMNSNNTDIKIIPDETVVKLIVFMIQTKNSDYAVYKFVNWNKQGNKQIAKIIQQGYNGNLKNFQACLSFAYQLTDCQSRRIAFLAIFKAMSENNHLGDPQVLDLAKLADLGCSIYMKDFLDEMKIYTDEVIKVWVSQIKGGNYTECVYFFLVRENYAWIYGLTRYIHEIVDGVYENSIKNFNNTLSFVESLGDPVYCYEGHYAMFEIMSSNHDIGQNNETKHLLASIESKIGSLGPKDKSIKETYEDLLKFMPRKLS